MDSNPLWPSDKDDTFEGFVKINLNCAESTNKVVFHSKNLNLKSIKFVDTLINSEIKILSSSLDNDTDFFTINLEKNCDKGKSYSLEVLFEGNIITNLYAFYKNSYKGLDGKIRQ